MYFYWVFFIIIFFLYLKKVIFSQKTYNFMLENNYYLSKFQMISCNEMPIDTIHVYVYIEITKSCWPYEILAGRNYLMPILTINH